MIFGTDLDRGGESVLVNGAVFKTVSETVRTGSGRFDSYTPPPEDRRQQAVGRRQKPDRQGGLGAFRQGKAGFGFVIFGLVSRLVSFLIKSQIGNRQ